MLKTTYKKAVPAGTEQTPLPPGWSEHQAPSGHAYYYNAETKISTYSRPTVPPPVYEQHVSSPTFPAPLIPPPHRIPSGSFRAGLSYQDRSRRVQTKDRPKKKKKVPECEPWLLVTTKLGRRFVHNPETNESLWKFPQDVLLATFEMDRMEQETSSKKQQSNHERDSSTDRERPKAGPDPLPPACEEGDAGDSDSYEEVEITDDEEGEGVDRHGGEDADETSRASKRLRKPSPDAPNQASGPIDFNEDDIAYQLAQMGEDYGLDPGEYGQEDDDGDTLQDAEAGDGRHDRGLPLSAEDSQTLFYELLSEHSVDPYATWERVLEKNADIVDDERYVAVPNMRSRKEAFANWSGKQMQRIQKLRAAQVKQNPRIPYLQFLHQHATPKLYWAEFKRKHRKVDLMREPDLSDKEREKLYREHINRLKLPESTRKKDLKNLLTAAAADIDSSSAAVDHLPEAVSTDLRYISLPTSIRDPLIEAFVSTLPPPASPKDRPLNGGGH